MATKNDDIDKDRPDQSWDAEAYAKRKAQRDEKKPAEWVTNPATGEKFCLRRVGALALAVSGELNHSLTNRAVESWKDKGLDVGESENGEAAIDPKEAQHAGRKNIEFATRIAVQACVIPKLGIGEGEIDPALLDDEDLLFIVDWATRPAGTLPMKGGGDLAVADLDRFPKKPGRRARTGTGG